jgi:tyrosine-protein phosphatase non-receptor type 23
MCIFIGASLVKGIPFNYNDPEISGPDIFRKLVPMEAHKASSLYRFFDMLCSSVC